ncbi:MAG: zf-HC2 domain-containing protein [Terracidiphilus sp.]|nr:zf-HC2 domain-containing protein [Terracidiphilus sp.]
MSSNFQFETHPDAEILNAFAEQALLPEERAEVLAHLGGCSRCREIVFLATEARFEEETMPALAATQAAKSHGSWLHGWFAGWRLMWIPACAVTAVVLVAMAVHLRRAGTETARLTPAPAISAQAAAPAPQAQSGKTAAPPAKGAPHTAAAPVEAKPPEDKSEGILAARVAVLPNKPAPLADNAPFRALDLEHGTKTLPRVALPPAPRFAVASTGTPGKERTESPTPAGLQQQANVAYATQTEKVFDANRKMNLRVASVEQEVNVPMAASVLKSAAVQTEFVPMQKSAVRMRIANLPNGEVPVSTVRILPRTLALAGDGTLYLSKDMCMHWQAVASQWQGKAVAVRLRGVAAADAGKSVQGLERIHEAADSFVPHTFELVNDKGQVWTSTDGLIWTAK